MLRFAMGILLSIEDNLNKFTWLHFFYSGKRYLKESNNFLISNSLFHIYPSLHGSCSNLTPQV